ncbi:MAG: DegV family EDD domain-containing protein [Lachnospiraceae bacterium]|nr:DegV family EDD domain-containing protein [Lachnospiraceae bacterium]
MIRRFFNYLNEVIKDHNMNLSDRVFIIFTAISELSLILALLGDIIFKEDIHEIIVLFILTLFIPLIVITGLKRGNMRLTIAILVSGLVFIIIPVIFFFGGGLEGGGVLWIIFSFMYIGLILSGRWRKVMFALLLMVAFGCYLLSYCHPELVSGHSREMFYIDSFISLILVGVVCFGMSWSQNELLKNENARARKEKERAEELIRAQNRFFTSMSHEIRTPLNSILGLNELTLMDGEATDEIVRNATGIQGSGKMLLSLINDILDFSKMEAGSMDIVPVDYRVDALITDMVNMTWIKAFEKGLEFNVSIDPDIPRVLHGDDVRIKQIIINILNNAVKYTKSGSIDFNLEGDQQDANTILLSITVSDTGIGIRKEYLPDLFDVFKRVDIEKNRHIEGTGLGLSIVKQLAELMGGFVTVNSVYGDGSTFNVIVKQGVVDKSPIGELNFYNHYRLNRRKYKSIFRAPQARILIVDDNQLNLDVEKRLLKGTELTIDTALSGRDALELTVKNRYDVILMDHLMPETDGIGCLETIRRQTGGLNRSTPVVVVTANAGSENRELFNRAGFDGYLVKPLSKDSLEETLMRHIPGQKLILSRKLMSMTDSLGNSRAYVKKAMVMVTSTSVCDLPDDIIKSLDIPIIPFRVHTEEGVFKDGLQMNGGELIRYLNSNRDANTSPPDIEDYSHFFSDALKRCHHIIHIAMTTSMSNDYEIACEAAKSFDNVTVINSECFSSSQGLLVLLGCKLARQNITVEEIVSEIERIKKNLRCSLLVDTTDYMVKRGSISQRMHKGAGIFDLHPLVKIRKDKEFVSEMLMGSKKSLYRKYIHRAFPADLVPDQGVLFITYVDVPSETLLWLKKEIEKTVHFENVVFQQASAALALNYGPGTLGLMYFIKSDKSYNIRSFFAGIKSDPGDIKDKGDYENYPEAEKGIKGSKEEELSKENEEKESESASEENTEEAARSYSKESLKEEDKAYSEDIPKEEEGSGSVEEETLLLEGLDFIDGGEALKNCGSKDAFEAILKIFYESLPEKEGELIEYYTSENWENYTIKVHALKSSAKLVGAMELSEKARLLEFAGKESNIEYIRDNHEDLMLDMNELKDELASYFGSDKEEEADKPLADEGLMLSAYEGIKEGAKEKDSSMIRSIIRELEPYALPKEHKEKYREICRLADRFDFNALLKFLEEETDSQL